MDGPMTSIDQPVLPTEADIMAVLRQVIDPELGADIVELGMAKGATISDDGVATITVALTTMGCPLRAQIRNDVRDQVQKLPGITTVTIDWTELTQPEKAAAMAKARRRIADNPPDTAVSPSTRVLMIASGKGGVGKSSVTTNLATAMASIGTASALSCRPWIRTGPCCPSIRGRRAAPPPQSSCSRLSRHWISWGQLSHGEPRPGSTAPPAKAGWMAT